MAGLTFVNLVGAALIVCGASLGTAAVADIAGRIAVVDADTFDVGGTRVRLHGIDAPEQAQTCTDRNGADWACGTWATAQAQARFGGQAARCAQIDTDRYGRAVARCAVGGQDVAEWLVLNGIATAYRDYSWDYDLAEKQAQVAGRGIWTGTVEPPSAFRSAPAGNAATQAGAGPQGCTIKGNISNSGQIYHMPHNRDYARTRIDEARGERWFCSESEARAAGWRPARN